MGETWIYVCSQEDNMKFITFFNSMVRIVPSELDSPELTPDLFRMLEDCDLLELPLEVLVESL